MTRYVIRRDSDNKIISTFNTKGGAPTETGTTALDIDAIVINGDTVPANVSDMGMGILVGSGPYTYTENPVLTELLAWKSARNDWIDSGVMTDDTKWKRCVKGNCQNHMIQSDWDALLLAYPQA